MNQESQRHQTEDCDLLVVGSGAGGLSAAVTAARHGLQVILIEKERYLGGTTALSGGWMWAPGNPLARQAGIAESIDLPRTYLKQVLGNHFNESRVQAFLEGAPRMVEFFDTQTAVHFEPGNHIPDTYGNLPGAGTGGRSVIAAPYDARALGAAIKLLRPPLRETTFFGMTIQAGSDLKAFMNVTRSLTAFVYVTCRVGRHLWDLAVHRRAMQLRNGSALVGRLIRAALDEGVELRTSTTIERLLQEGGKVQGAVIKSIDGELSVQSRHGVVLATGGFPHDAQRRRTSYGDTCPRFSVAVSSATGDGIRLGESAGGHVDNTLASPDALCPVSIVSYADGTKGRFPHIIERGKPGVIGVLANGQRFCNEGNGYHDYVIAMLDNVTEGEEVASWLICTHAFQRRYGLGASRPSPVPLSAYLRSGYLESGQTVAELAERCGIDVEGLQQTVSDYNVHARHGEDPAFHRGSTAYNRLQGDPGCQPNPCVAPIEHGPFYAVKVVPGSFGTFAGLETDGQARVLSANGNPILGLYAAGTDMASVMGGFYPAGGINLGSAMTFGYLAGNHVAGVADQARRSSREKRSASVKAP